MLGDGTIRRHPDIPWLRKPDDFAAMGKVQAALVHKAAELLRPGGTLVYSTCSLEREEGEDVIEAVLGAGAPLKPGPATAGELGVPPEAITDRGFLRTRPDMAAPGPQGEGHAGMDGFFAARLTRT